MIIIGHRGAAGLAPENTIAAMEAGIAHNVDAVEFDVRVSLDGVVIVNHDSFVLDNKRVKHIIAVTSFENLRIQKPDLATFEEIMNCVKQRVSVRIEVKPHEPTSQIIAQIAEYLERGWPLSKLLVCSYSQQILREIHQALPTVELMVIEKWSGVRASLRARELDTKYICLNQHWLWWGFIRSVHGHGMVLSTYVLDKPSKARRFGRYGLNDVVTDHPERYERMASR